MKKIQKKIFSPPKNKKNSTKIKKISTKSKKFRQKFKKKLKIRKNFYQKKKIQVSKIFQKIDEKKQKED